MLFPYGRDILLMSQIIIPFPIYAKCKMTKLEFQMGELSSAKGILLVYSRTSYQVSQLHKTKLHFLPSITSTPPHTTQIAHVAISAPWHPQASPAHSLGCAHHLSSTFRKCAIILFVGVWSCIFRAKKGWTNKNRGSWRFRGFRSKPWWKELRVDHAFFIFTFLKGVGVAMGYVETIIGEKMWGYSGKVNKREKSR